MSAVPTAHTSALLARHGAVAAHGLDAGVAAHYGNPVHEQRALARGRAVVDASQRGVVTVTGPDRLGWLTTLSSQVLTGLEPGRGTETLFLSVQGRIEFAPHVLDDGTTTWLITEADEAPGQRPDWIRRSRVAFDLIDRMAAANGVHLRGVLGVAVGLPGPFPPRIARPRGRRSCESATSNWTPRWCSPRWPASPTPRSAGCAANTVPGCT